MLMKLSETDARIVNKSRNVAISTKNTGEKLFYKFAVPSEAKFYWGKKFVEKKKKLERQENRKSFLKKIA